MEIQDLFGSKTQTLTRLEYLDIQPAKIDDSCSRRTARIDVTR